MNKSKLCKSWRWHQKTGVLICCVLWKNSIMVLFLMMDCVCWGCSKSQPAVVKTKWDLLFQQAPVMSLQNLVIHLVLFFFLFLRVRHNCFFTVLTTFVLGFISDLGTSWQVKHLHLKRCLRRVCHCFFILRYFVFLFFFSASVVCNNRHHPPSRSRWGSPAVFPHRLLWTFCWLFFFRGGGWQEKFLRKSHASHLEFSVWKEEFLCCPK